MDAVRVRNDAPTSLHDVNTPNSKSLDDIEFEIHSHVHNDDGSDVLVFSMKNCDAAIANALRRIMISEVETVAVESINLVRNTSIIQDEVLAHRIGLVPFNVDPKDLKKNEILNVDLFAQCDGSEDVKTVYSKSLEYIPMKGKNTDFPEDKIPGPIHGDIPLAKLLPGQQILFRAFLKPGIGKTHAKYSPVATASYRLMPRIKVVDVDGAAPFASAIKQRCPKNVFDIEDGDQLVVSRPMDCTMCRECIRQPSWEKVIALERVPDHFIFSIESVGMLPAAEIFKRACKVLASKAQHLIDELPKE